MPIDHVTIIDHPAAQAALTALRDTNTKTGDEFMAASREFSRSLAHEVPRLVPPSAREIETPMGVMASGIRFKPNILLVPVKRAGRGLVPGFLEQPFKIKVQEIGIRRNERTLEPEIYENPFNGSLTDFDLVVVADPMLATGGTACVTLSILKELGVRKLAFAGVVGCPAGVERVQREYPGVPIFLGAIDPMLNENGYIIPGLGDYGDRLFGPRQD
ncbi:uracil phosphoribosyltransferase [Candidatus Uhrbacteria bacterium]|nr:uracil phosphoribosyltransferase [Candidatus Uhrbacteria bacterium]